MTFLFGLQISFFFFPTLIYLFSLPSGNLIWIFSLKETNFTDTVSWIHVLPNCWQWSSLKVVIKGDLAVLHFPWIKKKKRMLFCIMFEFSLFYNSKLVLSLHSDKKNLRKETLTTCGESYQNQCMALFGRENVIGTRLPITGLVGRQTIRKRLTHTTEIRLWSRKKVSHHLEWAPVV